MVRFVLFCVTERFPDRADVADRLHVRCLAQGHGVQRQACGGNVFLRRSDRCCSNNLAGFLVSVDSYMNLQVWAALLLVAQQYAYLVPDLLRSLRRQRSSLTANSLATWVKCSSGACFSLVPCVTANSRSVAEVLRLCGCVRVTQVQQRPLRSRRERGGRVLVRAQGAQGGEERFQNEA
jgi:hypothetical protein